MTLIKYNAGKLVIDFHDLLQHLAPETRVEAIESLACDDEVIRHVTAQILDRWTENTYSGASAVTASPTPDIPLDVAWREVAKRSSEVAKREIERLEAALTYERECHNRTREDYHAIIDARRRA